MDRCAACGKEIDLFKSVQTTCGETWHWRCYHYEVDTKICDDNTHRKMTVDEWIAHQEWADAQHDGRGNQKSA